MIDKLIESSKFTIAASSKMMHDEFNCTEDCLIGGDVEIEISSLLADGEVKVFVMRAIVERVEGAKHIFFGENTPEKIRADLRLHLDKKDDI